MPNELKTTGLTSRMMKLALIEELKTLFKGKKYHGQQSMKPLKFFDQNLPIDNRDDETSETDDSDSPYIVVLTSEGKIPDKNSPQIVSVMLTICCYDESVERYGYADVENIKEDIIQHFREYPYFGGAFTVMCEPDHPIQWAHQMDDTTPYYFGAVLFDVTVPAKTGDQNKDWSDMI